MPSRERERTLWKEPGGTTAPAVRLLRQYDCSGSTTAPTVRPLRRYDRSDGTTAATVLHIGSQSDLARTYLPALEADASSEMK